MLGQEYYREELGAVTEIASLSDAFGMPMQAPQILSLLGYRYLIPGRMPNAPDGLDTGAPFIWRGMNRTQLIAVQSGASVDKSSHITNVPVLYNAGERFAKTLADLQDKEGNVWACYMTEAELLDEALFAHMEAANQNPAAKRPVTFGRLADYCKTLDESLLPSYQGEFNPVFTGCYTTRIGVKQKNRAAENALFAAELASAWAGRETAGLSGLSDAWAQLLLAQCHDAICGCHHDICNAGVREKLDFAIGRAREECGRALGDGAGNALIVLNPSGYSEERLIEAAPDALPAGAQIQKDGSRHYFSASLPAHGVRQFAIGPCRVARAEAKAGPAAYSGRTEHFAFDFAEVAPKIASNRFARSVFGQAGFGEVLFRHESGSMWDEALLEPPMGAECQDEEVVSAEEGPLFIKVTAKGRAKPGKKPLFGNSGTYWTGFEALSFTKEYIFPLRLPYFRLRLTVDFSGCNTKISLRIPVELDPLNAVALYDTPMAGVARKPYFEVPLKYEASMRALAHQQDYAHARGDYPALNWVDYRDDKVGLAVANSGTPGHQLVGRDIFISLIRSGTRCADGTMYPQPGAYDNGSHVFDFAFADHAPGDFAKAAWLGSILNREPVCAAGGARAAAATATAAGSGERGERAESLVSFEPDNILVSAIYPQGGSIVVRAYESFGARTRAAMRSARKLTCHSADMRGAPQGEQGMGDILFEPYEIRTFALTPERGHAHVQN
jgi:hypothetical protein